MSKMIPEHVPPQPSAAFSALVREKRDGAIGYLVTYAQKLLHRGLGEALQKHGVTVAQWMVLVVLWETDGLTQKELSQRVAVETATLSRTVDRMERDGLVTRDRSATDRRQVHVRLTGYGSGLWRDLVPEAEANQERALNGISEDEEEVLRGLLKRVIANMTPEKV
ncbi:MAG: MarR family transcriptional regulator [Sphingomonadales bacterium]|nr:MarR family transcriptional regulator [Sphingomonadales bacterium]